MINEEFTEDRFDDLFAVGVCFEDLTLTQDTIEDFLSARANYAEQGRVKLNKDGALEIAGVQVAKGKPRQTIYVLDLGDVRAVYQS